MKMWKWWHLLRGHCDWPSIVVNQTVEEMWPWPGKLAGGWIVGRGLPLDFIQTNCLLLLTKAWIKKHPRVKKPGTKPSGPAEGGCGAILYAETIQMCGYNMSTPPPFSNLSSPVASKSELFHWYVSRLKIWRHSRHNSCFTCTGGPCASDICINCLTTLPWRMFKKTEFRFWDIKFYLSS